MKNIIIMLFIFAACITANAQTSRVIKGAVVDKDENPLPGAKVMTINGSQETKVNTDGTFSLEVPIWTESLIARYSGMSDKKLKVGAGDMIFRMNPKQKGNWFVGANYSVVFETYYKPGHAGGLMVGYLGKWGGYGKATLGVISYKRSTSLYQNYTIGVTKRIIPPLHVFVGGGIDNNVNSPIFELGLIGKIGNHLLVNGGYQVLSNVLFIGAGYAF